MSTAKFEVQKFNDKIDFEESEGDSAAEQSSQRSSWQREVGKKDDEWDELDLKALSTIQLYLVDESYDHLVTIIFYGKDTLKMEEVKTTLLLNEIRHKSGAGKNYNYDHSRCRILHCLKVTYKPVAIHAMASRGRRGTQAREDEQRREERDEQHAPAPQGPTVLPPPSPVDYGVFMQGLAQAPALVPQKHGHGGPSIMERFKRMTLPSFKGRVSPFWQRAG
ncbi:hypothetical protein Taro_010688 [Colocasia esculenta]|uniref:Uncharacterized protein n=1 Tax=Colocasia esculenta TaxID=4460 RepID=A0A843TZL4_COLES|nr:hypothetical protein [Colocasia esculenta]